MGMALISLLTWIYLLIVENSQSYLLWSGFAAVAVLAVWTNYAVLAILLLLLVDLLWFHRRLAREKARTLLAVAVVVTASCVPLLRLIFGSAHDATVWRDLVGIVGYPVFSLFGSAAIAPWYWALSIPVALCALALSLCAWFSPGRKWMVYFVLLLAALLLSGHMDEKRILFIMSWFFLAIGLAVSSSDLRVSRIAQGAVLGLLLLGWTGIVSGKHYATTNLLEPWPQAASEVAGDMRQGRPTVISDTPVFFLYLDYQLGLQADPAPKVMYSRGTPFYASHGYSVYSAVDALPLADRFHGEIILARGTSQRDDVWAIDQLTSIYRHRCTLLKEYKAAPDPALEWKKRFATTAPALAFRVDVYWFDCP